MAENPSPVGINLIPELSEREVKGQSNRRNVNLIAIGSLGVVGIIILVIILYQVYLALVANNVKDQSSQLQQKIGQLADVEISTLALKDKLSRINKILKNAFPASAAAGEVLADGAPITISGVEMQDNQDVLVNGVAGSSDVLGAWLDNLSADKFFGHINLVSLVRDDKTPGYSFSILMNYTKKGLAPG